MRDRSKPASSYRFSGSSSFVSDLGHDEDQHPVIRPADTTASQTNHGVPKSRTFNVFSSLAHSLSRASLSSRGNTSRNVSGDSAASSSAPKPHDHAFTTPGHPQEHSVLSSTNHTSRPAAGSPSNPTEVTRAMPPQYWAGRFMALHDRFHNELLEPERLNRICEAQAARLSLTNGSACQATKATAAAKNNPSTSAYALTRVARTNSHSSSSSSRTGLSRIPQSATSGAILQTTPYSTTTQPPPYFQAISSSSRYPFATQLRLSETAVIPEDEPFCCPSTGHTTLALSTRAITGASTGTDTTPTTTGGSHVSPSEIQPRNQATNSQTGNHPPAFDTKNNHRRAFHNTPGAPHDSTTDDKQEEEEYDEEAITRRVFRYLSQLCTTREAQTSLRAWQAAYARKTSRLSLLPVASSFSFPSLPPPPPLFSAAPAVGGTDGGGAAALPRFASLDEVACRTRRYAASDGQPHNLFKEQDGQPERKHALSEGQRQQWYQQHKEKGRVAETHLSQIQTQDQSGGKEEPKSHQQQQNWPREQRMQEQGQKTRVSSTGTDASFTGHAREVPGQDQHQSHSHHDLGKRSRGLVKRLRESLAHHHHHLHRQHEHEHAVNRNMPEVDGANMRRGGATGDIKGKGRRIGTSGSGEGYQAYLESLAAEEKGKKGPRRFSLF